MHSHLCSLVAFHALEADSESAFQKKKRYCASGGQSMIGQNFNFWVLLSIERSG